MAGIIDKAKEFIADKVADIPMPEASVEDVDIKGVGREGVSYHARVGVMNPYSHSLPICEVKYTLKSNARVILSGSMADPGSLAGNTTTKLDVPMLVPHSILVSLVKDVCTDWDIDYELELGLVIDLPVIGNFTIPLRSKGEVKLPTLKDYF